MSSAAKVGAVMLVVLVIGGFFILRIEDIRIDRQASMKEIKVKFDSVAGLDKKAAVRVAGVRVGKVSHVELSDDGKALVTLEVDGSVELHRGASAQIANLGLLGEKYVELLPGSPNAPLLAQQENVVLRGGQPASIDDVTSQVSDIAKDVKAITASLRNAMGGAEGERRMVDIVENVRSITDRVRLVLEVNEGNINATAANFKKITDDLRVEIPRIAASIDRVANSIGGTVGENREDVRAVVANLKELSSDLRTTAQNLNDITGKARSGEGTVGKLLYSDEAHDKLTSALSSVESGVNELKNTLGRVNKIKMELGIKTEYLAGFDPDPVTGFDTKSRTGVMLNLVPNPERNRFYRFEMTDDPHGNEKEKVTEVTVTDDDGNSTTTVTRQRKFEREFLISAQAGWKLDDRLGLRVGLIDSFGGVGADYDFNDRARVTTEAFDFGGRREELPQLRFIGRYDFRKEKPQTPALYVSTGVEDVLNDTIFSVGGGIRWTDEDLKYLLGSIPIK